ncbi:MAG: hypothetical protein J5I47_06170 [Vicingus serpentipes]|nr:hypothetical protein [Vicingus serpentipes]
MIISDGGYSGIAPTYVETVLSTGMVTSSHCQISYATSIESTSSTETSPGFYIEFANYYTAPMGSCTEPSLTTTFVGGSDHSSNLQFLSSNMVTGLERYINVKYSMSTCDGCAIEWFESQNGDNSSSSLTITNAEMIQNYIHLKGTLNCTVYNSTGTAKTLQGDFSMYFSSWF